MLPCTGRTHTHAYTRTPIIDKPTLHTYTHTPGTGTSRHAYTHSYTHTTFRAYRYARTLIHVYTHTLMQLHSGLFHNALMRRLSMTQQHTQTQKQTEQSTFVGIVALPTESSGLTRLMFNSAHS